MDGVVGARSAGPPVSFGRRVTDLARTDPHRPAVTCGSAQLSRAELEAAANRLARRLAASGVTVGAMVTIALPNSLEFMVATVAAWKLGAVPQPVSPRLPRRELRGVIELAESRVVVGTEEVLGVASLGDATHVLPVDQLWPSDLDDGPLEDAVSPAWKAPTSGGSTGMPKLIVSGDAGLIRPDGPPPLLLEPDDCLVMPGPLYHNGPLVWTCQALLWGAHVVLLHRFDAEATLTAVDEHRAGVVYLVPTMMKRIWRLPAAIRDGFDLSSLRVVWHLAEPCPPWLKQAWIDWLGPERIVELYAGTEGQVATVITGTEWLDHRGSVGRPINGEISICDPEGLELPPGTEGEVWLRSRRRSPSYRYVGASARRREGGWESLGDCGWLDADGYLYLGDRMTDMILTGGANVYPAEVEAAILEHPAVSSCAVIGLPDDDRGNIVHALVEADPDRVDSAELNEFLAERLVTYKLPRSIEFVDEPLRDDAGKVRRSRLREQRIGREASAGRDASAHPEPP
ncbi:MAG: AMP-binding protein [Acidimicrobiales bacterium]